MKAAFGFRADFFFAPVFPLAFRAVFFLAI
jgi:hypothetical protein